MSDASASTHIRIAQSKSSSAARHCECCGEPMALRLEAASVSYGHRHWVWCLPCWDTDPKAVEQYREAGRA